VPEPFDWQIIDRHLAGESSDADEAALRRGLADDPRNAELLVAARRAASRDARSTAAEFDVDRAWSRVRARIEAASGRGELVTLARGETEQGVAKPRRSARRLAVASVLAAAALIAVVWRSARDAQRAAIATLPAPYTVAAGNGQQIRVTLRDGSRVVLNAGSRLRASIDAQHGAREVVLEGEALFEVVHDAARPFRVHARGSVAEDLGTRFVVRAYPEQRGVDVVVADGRVALGPDAPAGRRSQLGAGTRGHVEADGRVTVATEPDVDRWLAWTRGAFVLDGVTLADAAREMERRYDVRIEVVGDELARRRVSGRFGDEPVSAVLDALCVAVDARWTRVGERIVVTPSR
jgi:transmembrane sensor